MFTFSVEMVGHKQLILALRGLLEPRFPESMWDITRTRLEKFMRARVRHITNYRTRPSTYKWRQSMSKHGHSVEAHIGTLSPVLRSDRVGRRTGTFLNDVRESQPPGVSLKIGLSPKDGVTNGVLVYEIVPSAFARVRGQGYPIRFNKYLIERSIVPEEGILGMDSSEEEALLDTLENSVADVLMSRW